MNGEPEQPPLDPLQIAFRDAVRAKIRRDLAAEAATSERLRNDRVPHLREVIAAARAEGLCRGVWLFGSYAWGQPTERSDIDLLVDGDADEIAWRVSRALDCEVDGWPLTAAPAELVARARSEGIAL